MRFRFLFGIPFAVLIADPALGAGDAKRGAQLFQQCMACHSVQPGEHLTGPSLAHVWDRKAGTADGFARYSGAVKRSGITWNGSTPDKWRANPAHPTPGQTI